MTSWPSSSLEFCSPYWPVSLLGSLRTGKLRSYFNKGTRMNTKVLSISALMALILAAILWWLTQNSNE